MGLKKDDVLIVSGQQEGIENKQANKVQPRNLILDKVEKRSYTDINL